MRVYDRRYHVPIMCAMISQHGIRAVIPPRRRTGRRKRGCQYTYNRTFHHRMSGGSRSVALSPPAMRARPQRSPTKLTANWAVAGPRRRLRAMLSLQGHTHNEAVPKEFQQSMQIIRQRAFLFLWMTQLVATLA